MKEHEIRPKNIFDEYLRLAKIDTAKFFSSKRELFKCPSCDSEGKDSFVKDGFNYCECATCNNLFVSPRPSLKALSDYYENSASSKFWATTFYKETEHARREKIWKPKASLVFELLKKFNTDEKQVVDIGGGYGIFAEEMSKLIVSPIYVVEPAPHLAKICKKKGFKVIQKFLEDVTHSDLGKGSKCFVSFELFEHLHSPLQFLKHINYLMKPNDLLIFTTLSSAGLDIQVLWEDSPSVSPPHHLNFFNPKSIKVILEKTGFRLLEVSTPGRLDLDILYNNRSKIKHRFWKNFIKESNSSTKQEFQKFISKTGLSSHMMVIGEKI